MNKEDRDTRAFEAIWNSWMCPSIFCGLVPLIAGLSIFAVWTWTRWDWLQVAGLLTVFGGVLFFILGWLCLKEYADLVRSIPFTSKTRQRAVLWSYLAAVLLLANLPAAAGVIVAVDHLKSRYVIAVFNQSSETIESFVVSGAGVNVNFGTIDPAKNVTRSCYIAGQGELKFTARLDGQQIQGTVDGYVMSGRRGDQRARIVINADESVDVFHFHNRD